jgi:hypothetical protein
MDPKWTPVNNDHGEWRDDYAGKPLASAILVLEPVDNEGR